MRTKLTHRQRAKLQRKATLRAVSRMFVPADIVPYASLANVKPGSAQPRRPVHFC